MKNQILRLSATQAARDFSHLLDQVAGGAEAVIERHNQTVATMGPAFSVPRRLSECLAVELPKPSVAPDPDFGADLTEIIAGHTTAEPPQWD